MVSCRILLEDIPYLVKYLITCPLTVFLALLFNVYMVGKKVKLAQNSNVMLTLVISAVISLANTLILVLTPVRRYDLRAVCFQF